MTKKEHEAFQKFMNRTGAIENDRMKAFKELQDLSRKHGLTVWCNAEDNAKQLQNVADEFDKRRAEHLYNYYVSLEGASAMLSELGGVLAELNFWKNC